MARKELICFFVIAIMLASFCYSVEASMPNQERTSVLSHSQEEKTRGGSDPGLYGTTDQVEGAWHEFLDRNPWFSISEALERQNPNGMADWWRNNAYLDGNKVRLIVGSEGNRSLSLHQLGNLATKYGGIIVSTVSFGGQAKALVVELPLDSVSGLTEEAYTLGLIGYAEPDMKIQATVTPNDPDWSMQWGPGKIQSDWAWNTTKGDHSIIVAVVDTGIAYNHTDIGANYVPLGYDWVNNDNDPFDDHGHGTHCAGIIAAVMNNGIGIAGIAQVQVMAEKVLGSGGSGLWEWVANGIINATDAGAKIISMSLGGSGDSQLVHDAIKYAYEHGVLVIAAAGNDNSNAKFYPAGYDEVISVAATDQNDAKAYFSNWGEKVELAAPGVDIYSTVPWGYESWSGTSMACPHVSGVAALAWSMFPGKTRDWIRLWLRYTADDLGAPGFDIYYGYGRINAKTAVERTPPAHELILTDFEKPRYAEPGKNALINASVINFGENDESNLQVQLLINGTSVVSIPIDSLASGTTAKVSLSWNPSAEGRCNITLYVIPVPGETTTTNNAITKMITVRITIGHVLVDQTHYNLAFAYYSLLEANLTERGYTFQALTAGPISFELLRNYDVLIIPDAASLYSVDELSDIETYVLTGGGLLVMGSSYPYIYQGLTSFAGIGWNTTSYFYGIATNITHHEVTDGVTGVYFGYTTTELLVQSPAISLVRRGTAPSGVLLAVSEEGAGRVICVSDGTLIEDPLFNQADNFRLACNMVDWLASAVYEAHELVVNIQTPQYLYPGNSSWLNTTVYNVGLSNETNVNLQLLINGAVAKNVIIPELTNGTSYETAYLWTPSALGRYNVTAYVTPVTGEILTADNSRTKYVNVMYPLIQPEAGEYADYEAYMYDATLDENTFMEFINFTYDHYVAYDKVYVNLSLADSYGNSFRWYSVVNTFTRYVEDGAWAGYWPWWIETGIAVGYKANILTGTATVNASRFMFYQLYPVSCWELLYTSTDRLYYDKGIGLMIAWIEDLAGNRVELRLVSTNVPINTTYDHELGVSLEAPRSLWLGGSAILNATAYNLGHNTEYNANLSILVSGATVKSFIIPVLANDTVYTISCVWSPASTGRYLVEAIVSPVSGEATEVNNEASKTTVVFSYTRIVLPHQWHGGGSLEPLSGDDFAFSYFAPFPVKLCGFEYRWLYLSSNGLVTLSPSGLSHDNSLSGLREKLAIAPAWDDWVIEANANGSSYGIYTWFDSSTICIRWCVSASYNRSITANFEVLITKSGAIRFNYGQFTGNVSATIGISSGEGFWLAENKTDLNYADSILFTDDTIPPAAITDLAVTTHVGNSITLTFTAPGDDGNIGTVAGYVVKYSPAEPITDANWDSAATYYDLWVPHPAGYREDLEVSGLISETTYWFAIKSYDEVPWFSGLSDCVSWTTGDFMPPAAIMDLAIKNTTDTWTTLTWTAVGDDGLIGRAAGYIVKYSTSEPILEWNWDNAETLVQSWIPLPSGSKEIHDVGGLHPNTTYWFAIRSYDESMNYAYVSNTRSTRTSVAGTSYPSNDLLVIALVGVAAISVAAVVGVAVVLQRRSSSTSRSRRYYRSSGSKGR